MFENIKGMSGFRLLALAGALVVSGCGGSELDAAALEAEESMGVAQQGLQTCDYCPEDMGATPVGTTVPCYCTASQASSNRSLWGTDVYTSDSSVCRAAVHAGAITTSGGFVAVTMQPGQPTYTASTRNGVSSNSYTSWQLSYSVAAGSGCALPCPSHLTGYRGQNGAVVSCTCTASAIGATYAYKSVWGTDTYTDDSSVCYAAIHAGVITPSGGVVNAVIAPAQLHYSATTRNGVSTYSYTNSSYTYGSYSFQ